MTDFVEGDLGHQIFRIPDGEMGHLTVTLMPFSRAQFLGVFERYNSDFWPLEIAALMLGVAILWLLVRNHPRFTPIAAWGLALMWAWTGISYFWFAFSSISKAGQMFAPFFIFEAILLCFVAVNGQKLTQTTKQDWPTTLGAGLTAYALFAYPLIGPLLGERFARMPMFGVTPCALTLYTLGVFLMADRVFPRALWIIPLLWTIVGGGASLLFDMPQDLVLLGAGMLAVAAVWKRMPEKASA
jgi:hypothetical protein